MQDIEKSINKCDEFIDMMKKFLEKILKNISDPEKFFNDSIEKIINLLTLFVK